MGRAETLPGILREVNMKRKALIGILAAAALVILAASLIVVAANGSDKVAAATTTTNPHAHMTIEAFFGKGVRAPAQAAKDADIVVYGTVVGVDPGRWNSADGNQWTSKADTDVPAIYRTFYVKLSEVLKGKPKWGTPVAFIVVGGTAGEVSGPVTVGDAVLVFGRDLMSEGGLYGNVVWQKDAYFAQHNEFSIFVERAGTLEVTASEKDPEYATASLSALRAELSAVPTTSSTGTSTTSSLGTSTN
jgi:hypothetical protein